MGVKINDTTEFPAVTPASTDRVLGVDVSNTTNDANGEVVTFTVEDLRNASSYATAAQGAKADTAVQPAAIADFEDTTALNARDTANRSRANHTGSQAQSTVTDLVADLAAKAPLASPVFTGNPTAPTQAASDNSTKIATTAYVDAAAGGGGGLVPISKTTASASATVDIELTGGYSAYEIRFESIEAASTSNTLEMRVSTDSGSTYESGASDYTRHVGDAAFNGSSTSDFTGSFDNTTDAMHLTGISQMGAGSGIRLNGRITIYQAGDMVFCLHGSTVFKTGSGIFFNAIPFGAYNTVATVTHVRFLMASGNITSGDFHLYGIADGA